jgi:hypothetical protein
MGHPKPIFEELMEQVGFEGVHFIRLTDYKEELGPML